MRSKSALVRPRAFRVTAAAAAVGCLAAASSVDASVSRWTEPQKVGNEFGLGGAGIDDSGRITAAWERTSDHSVWMATRVPGAASFDAPRMLAAPADDSRGVAIAVSGAGHVLIVWREQVCDPECGPRLVARSGTRDGDLGPKEVVSAAPAYEVALDVNNRGAAIVAWQGARDPFESTEMGVQAAYRAGPGRFDAPQALDTSARGVSPRVAVVLGEGGAAAAAWQRGEPAEPGVSIVASVHRADGFGRPELVFDGRKGAQAYDPAVTITPQGEPAVAFTVPPLGNECTDPPLTTGMHVSSREGGEFRPPKRIGPSAISPGAEIAVQDDQQVLWWEAQTNCDEEEAYEVWVSFLDPDGSFPNAGSFLPRHLPGTLLAFDSFGNALAIWTTTEGQQLRATVLTRLGLIEPVHAFESGNAQLHSFTANAQGAAVALYTAIDAENVMAVVRPPDETAPALTVTGRVAGPRRVFARLRCDEPCRVRVRANLRGARGRGRLKTRVLNAGRRVRIRTPLSRADRLRLRELDESQDARVVLAARARDAVRNRRVARRRLQVHG